MPETINHSLIVSPKLRAVRIFLQSCSQKHGELMRTARTAVARLIYSCMSVRLPALPEDLEDEVDEP